MKTLDRYLARQFLINFIILAVVLMTLYILVDLIVDLDAFIEVGARRAARQSGENAPWWAVLMHAAGALFEYEAPLMTMLYVTFAGLLAIGAMGFTFTALAQSRELIAMVMGGWSMFRIAAPVIAVAGILVGAALPIQELLLPRLAERLTRSKGDLKHERGPTLQVTLMDDGEGNLFSAARFDARAGLLEDLTILERDEQGRLLRRITAPRALWEAQRQGWILENATLELPGTQPPAPADDSPAQSQAQSETADQVAGPVLFPTGLSPAVLLAARHAMYARLLSARQLLALARNNAMDAWEIQTIMHGRLSYVVVNILLVVMAIRFFLTREPVNMMVQGIKATACLLPLWLMAILLVTVGVSWLNPVASAWLAVVLMLPLAAAVLQTVKT